MKPVSVGIVERPASACGDVLEFLESLPFAPRQHDPRWQSVYDRLAGESFMAATARADGRLVGVSTFCVFDGPFGRVLHANPFMGYGGCSCLPEAAEGAILALLGAVLDWAAANGCITATVAMPPFSDELEGVYESAMAADYRFENFYQYSCLDEHPLRKLRRKRRSAFLSEIRRAERAGVELVTPEAGREVDLWLDIYEARYAEIGAQCLPRAYLRGMWEVFAPTGHVRLELARLGGEVVGGTMFLVGRGIVDYFATAFTGEAMKLQVGTMLLNGALDRFLGDRIERFNWQSSPSRDGGVYAYKKRWGAEEGTYPILTRVLGDTTALLSRPLRDVREAYSGHFVLPYRLWEAQ